MPYQSSLNKVLIINESIKSHKNESEPILVRYLSGELFDREMDPELGYYRYIHTMKKANPQFFQSFEFLEYNLNDLLNKNEVDTNKRNSNAFVELLSNNQLPILVVFPYDLLTIGHNERYVAIGEFMKAISQLLDKFSVNSCILACIDPPVSTIQLKNTIEHALNSLQQNHKKFSLHKAERYVIAINPGDHGESRHQIIEYLLPFINKQEILQQLLDSSTSDTSESKHNYISKIKNQNTSTASASTLNSSSYTYNENTNFQRMQFLSNTYSIRSTFFGSSMIKNMHQHTVWTPQKRNFVITTCLTGAMLAALASLDYSDSRSWFQLCVSIVLLVTVYEIYQCIMQAKKTIPNEMAIFLNKQEPRFRQILKGIEHHLLAVKDIETNASEALQALTTLLQEASIIQQRFSKLSEREIRRFGGNYSTLVSSLEAAVTGTNFRFETLLDTVQKEVNRTGRLSEQMCNTLNSELYFFNKSFETFLSKTSDHAKIVSKDTVNVLNHFAEGIVNAAQHDHFRPTVNAKAEADISVCSIM